MKKIYLTVDTECHDFSKLNQYIYGRKGREVYGIEKILQICTDLDVPVNVFLDVCECYRYGDKYTQDIVDLVHKYNQHIYFHFHPNFLSGDDKRSFLWQYTESEQKVLLSKGLETFFKYKGKSDKLVFRAGRYGVNDNTFKILKTLCPEVLDLSYFSYSQKMCKLPTERVNVFNIPTIYNGITILPNTTYVGFRYFGKFHAFILNVPQTTYNEFRRFIRKTKLTDVVYTMHSWDFIRKWFFLHNYIQGDKAVINKFKKCVAKAKQNGFKFASLDEFEYTPNREDELQDLCSGLYGKIVGVYNNFIRFYGIGRLTKKYFVVYCMMIFIVLIAISIMFMIMI
jgi:hypothetical protein